MFGLILYTIAAQTNALNGEIQWETKSSFHLKTFYLKSFSEKCIWFSLFVGTMQCSFTCRSTTEIHAAPLQLSWGMGLSELGGFCPSAYCTYKWRWTGMSTSWMSIVRAWVKELEGLVESKRTMNMKRWQDSKLCEMNNLLDGEESEMEGKDKNKTC